MSSALIFYFLLEFYAFVGLQTLNNYLVAYFILFLAYDIAMVYHSVCFKQWVFKTSFLLGSILFSILFVIANYVAWFYDDAAINGYVLAAMFIIVLVGTYFCLNALQQLANKINISTCKSPALSIVYFFVSFIAISSIYLTTLFLFKQGGCTSADSLNQLSQALSGDFFNHHPAYHTMVLRVLLKGNKYIFPEMNQLTLFFAVQILFMAFCFSFSIFTLRQLNVRIGWLAALLVFYCLFPFHIVYSMTLGKDVPFAGFVLLAVISFVRIIKNIGDNGGINGAICGISIIGICLFRPNGIVSIVLFMVCALVVLFRLHKNKKLKQSKIIKITICVSASLAVGLILYYPVLALLNINQEGFEEGLSVPLQQFNKAVYTYHDLTNEESSIVDNAISVDNLSNYYFEGNADSIKAQLFQRNKSYFEEHLGEFVAIYLKEGLRHPFTYMTAFVDQTVGFGNAGYNLETNCGLIFNRVNTQTQEIKDWLDWLIQLFLTNPVLCVLNSVGLYFGILLALAAICIFRRQGLELLPIALLLSILLTVILSTPLWSEYRYAYFLFCSVPFVALELLSSSNIVQHT